MSRSITCLLFNSGLLQNKVSGSTSQSWLESPKWIYAGIQELATFSPLPMIHDPSPATRATYSYLSFESKQATACSYAHHHHHVLSRATGHSPREQSRFTNNIVCARLLLLSCLCYRSTHHTAPTPIGLVPRLCL
jgi:hypothetical protein